MDVIFYLFTLMFIVQELSVVFGPRQYIEKIKKIIKLFKENRDSDPETWSQEYMSAIRFGLFNMVYIIWLLIGLITFQWPIFLAIFIIGLIRAIIESVIGRKVLPLIIDSSLSLGLLVFLILNKFHFKLDLFELINGLF